MDTAWQSDISEICKKMYPAWLRSAEYWRNRFRLREEAYDIMARAIEYVFTHEKPQPADFASYVFAKMKSIAMNNIRTDGRIRGLEFDIAVTETDGDWEPRESEWSRYREQTARLRGDSFIHADLLTLRSERSQGTIIYSTSYYNPKTQRLQAAFSLNTRSANGKWTRRVFANKQKAADAFYKL